MKNLLLFKGWTLLYCILLCFISSQSFATSHSEFSRQQQHTITGTVTHNNMPMTGVTITVKGKNTIAISGEDGKFSIAANGNDTLIFEYLGFKTQTIPVNSKTNLTVSLEEDVNDLKEVTVNAGYYTVKESERIGSISKITAKDIEKQPVTNVLAAMQGRMAGVSITQTTGIPGGGFDIQIRGQNSLRTGGNNPLYLIDGVPFSSDATGSSRTSPFLPSASNPLTNINPNEIESIEVLKDADATAIYGSRGANGVVLVTTKKGRAGQTKFTGSVSRGFGKVTRFMDLMDTRQYLAMRREAYTNDGYADYPEEAYDINGTWDQERYTNWQKKLTGGTADIINYQAGVAGGSEQTRFSLSGNYNKETTVFPGDFNYQKYNMLASVNHESKNKKFRMGFSAGYTAQDNDQPTNDFTRESRQLAPNAPALYDALGNLNWENNTWNNPLRYLEGGSLMQTGSMVASSQLSYTLLEGLELKTGLGFTDLRHTESAAAPNTQFSPGFGYGSDVSIFTVNNLSRRSWLIEPQLNWKRSIGQVKLDVLAGGTFQQQNSAQLLQFGEGFASNALITNLGSAAKVTVLSSDAVLYKYEAFFGRINLNWLGRYIVNATGRRDGSSRFGPGKQFANFGAVGAAWLFSEEPLIKNNMGLLSFGKLRASYGTTGNDQIGDYQFMDTYRSSGSNYQGTIGLQPSRLFNADFGWETNKKLEAAIEAGFFNDRITLSAAWYRNRSSSQLVGIPLPGTTGFTSIQANLDAEVENRGVELSLHTANFQKGNFSWSTNFNISFAKNELLSFPGLASSTYKNQFVIGQPLNIRKVYHFTGLDAQTGIYQFEDYNGDGKITSPDDKQYSVDMNPKYFGGLQNTIRYGAVTLDFLFQFVKQLNYNSNYLLGMPGDFQNQPAAAAQHWQSPGDIGPYQQFSTGVNAEAYNAYVRYNDSDAGISDASYIRLKNVSLSFDVPQRWTKKVQLRLSVQGQNLVTITHYKGADPEFRTSGFLPPLKVFTTSLQLTF